eukprot:292926-Rhodomonas_salina.1
MAVHVTAPAVAQAPEILIDGPNEIGWCDWAVLTVEVSGGMRELQYAWRCDNCERGEALASELASQTGGSVSVPPSGLAEGR